MKQPYDQKEIIVVNDGSKDNLDEVIKKNEIQKSKIY